MVTSPALGKFDEKTRLARTLLRVTGLSNAKAGVRVAAGVICWLAAIYCGLCGLALFWGYTNPWIDRDVLVTSYAFGIIFGLLFPIFRTLSTLKMYSRWLTNLKSREVVLSLVTVPTMGAIVAHGIWRHWLSGFLRLILPFAILGIVTIVVSFFQRISGARLSREMVWSVLIVTTMGALVLCPLVSGAKGSLRMLGLVSASWPFFVPLWGSILQQAARSVEMTLPDSVIPGIILLSNLMTCGVVILVLFRGAKYWQVRLESLGEKT
jgi:hypothetical protein